MLTMSAVPRSNHITRMLPPSQARGYAQQHDDAIWATFCEIMGTQAWQGDQLARDIASLPGREAGLGLRSAAHASPAAYWASWMAALPVGHEKWPRLADRMVDALEQGSTDNSIGEADSARAEFMRQGAEAPTWAEARDGAEPPQPPEGHDLYDFRCGWQSHMCTFAENHFRVHTVLPRCSRSHQALLLSQATGPGSTWLRAVPSEPALHFRPLRLQVALRRRLRWPLPSSGGQCCNGCKKQLGSWGDRAAACGIQEGLG